MKKSAQNKITTGCLVALMALLTGGGFAQSEIRPVKSALRGMPQVPSFQQIAQERAGAFGKQASGERRGVVEIKIKPPSSKFRVFKQQKRLFQIEYPENWRVYKSANGGGVTIAPRGGFVVTGGKERDLICGVTVNYYDPFEKANSDGFFDQDDSKDSTVRGDSKEGSVNLSRATRELVNELLLTHPNLRTAPDLGERERMDGEPGSSMVLIGISPMTQQQGLVTVFTRELPDGRVIYALFMTPEQHYNELARTFNRMMSSLGANDETANR